MIVPALISLGALVLATVIARSLRSPIAAVALALVSGVWLVANKHLEGPVLITFSPGHGLTPSDLLGFAGYFYSLRLVWVQYADSNRRHLPWLLIGLCTVAFVVWPLAKLLIWPGISNQVDFSWFRRLLE